MTTADQQDHEKVGISDADGVAETTNTVTGAIPGISMQAGTVYGGLHILTGMREAFSSQDRITQIPTGQVSAAEQQDMPAPECSVGTSEDDGATASQMTQPLRGRPPGRSRKPAWRRLAPPAALAAATSLVIVISLSAFTDSDTSAQRAVIDDGRAFGSGGSSRFNVTVDPAHTEIRLIRRLDAGIAKQTASVTVDGALAAVWQPLPEGTHGWKDQSVILPSVLTLGRREFTITNTFVSSDLDFNEFTYFVDQKVNDVWSRADTVDIGPNHPESEAAHHYRITNQSWSGTHPFNYLE
jgi:hypothetical protein